MTNCHLTYEDGGIQVTADVEGGELFFNHYIGTRGACVASNAEDSAGNTYSGGPFTVSFSLRPVQGRWVVRAEVRHDPEPFRSALP